MDVGAISTCIPVQEQMSPLIANTAFTTAIYAISNHFSNSKRTQNFIIFSDTLFLMKNITNDSTHNIRQENYTPNSENSSRTQQDPYITHQYGMAGVNIEQKFERRNKVVQRCWNHCCTCLLSMHQLFLGKKAKKK